MPKYGTFNLHASLLPQYRGAAPINWAIINGDTETGITTFFLDKEIDTGQIIQQVKIPIKETDDVGIIHDKLMVLGGDLVIETVNNIINKTIKPIPQEEIKIEGKLRPAPKIFKETCRIDWTQPTEHIYNLIRGLSPYPAAWSELSSPNGEKNILKIYESKKAIEKNPTERAGTIKTDGKHYFRIATGDGYIYILQLQLPGKKKMTVEEFLRGHNIMNYLFQ
jgi:methionyl-tRNA formyltransferase